VVDSGAGIPDAIRDHLFEPFVTFGKANGTGLGLAVVKKVVDDHGGSIAVEKAPGGGTAFALRLPGAAAPGAA
jgi:signal transduction histidine kinase